MKQIGLAVHNYVSTNEAIPPSAIASQTQNYQDQGVLCRLLPFLEQNPDYNSINFNYGVRGIWYPFTDGAWNVAPLDNNIWSGDWGRSNATANITYVQAFLCPSDGENGGNNTFFINGQNRLICTTNYYWNVGTARFFNGGMVNGPSYSPGVLDNEILNGGQCANKVIKIASFVDGTSNTAIMSESLQSVEGQENPSKGLRMVYSQPGPSWSSFASRRYSWEPSRLARRPVLPEYRARGPVLVER